MAQIAGRAGRHQRDGTFGTLAGDNGPGGRGAAADAEFTDEEVYAIEEHRFAPLTKLYWRDAEPRTDSLDQLIRDLETPPDHPELILAPEAIDLAVLKRLTEEPGTADGVRGNGAVRRFWEVCRLPDFRQQGAETHSRFVARLWQDLRGGQLGADYVAQAIAQLDHTSGDIDTLQGRIAAVRSWAYITQRPDWVLARDEMAARARAVEARLSDALHARLTERFVNRRTAVLMKKLGADASLLPVRIGSGEDDDAVFVDDEHIGALRGFRFHVDPLARASDRKLLLAAAERHLPELLGTRALTLAGAIGEHPGTLALQDGAIRWQGEAIMRVCAGRSTLVPTLTAEPVLDAIPVAARRTLDEALRRWFETRLAPLAPLRRLEEASRAFTGGPELRALLIRLAEAGGVLVRDGSTLEWLDKAQRTMLARLGVTVGALDLFVPAMLRPAAQAIWHELCGGKRQSDAAANAMSPVAMSTGSEARWGYRRLGRQDLRVDIAEKLLREAHAARLAGGGDARRPRDFVLDPARAVSTGLTTASYARLLQLGGFVPIVPRPLPDGVFGPPRPLLWRWRPQRRSVNEAPAPIRPRDGAFAGLAGMFG
jgi:ATP-dependent RNA helicase SUPV3L1/SUV3